MAPFVCQLQEINNLPFALRMTPSRHCPINVQRVAKKDKVALLLFSRKTNKLAIIKLISNILEPSLVCNLEVQNCSM